ncbi:hypothetical protein FSP39_024337 [Pinctada imbricata]|uniref:Uncharacterized protein n=1 Tax=Pinctada imbricata TaxID=66713 RepID=A0AA89C235_PINIB|nr:hypothetical protein FSP39_024337 [Pinctada imbricata]
MNHAGCAVLLFTLVMFYADTEAQTTPAGRSSDNVTIIMRRSHLYKAGSERITPHQDFEITGQISQSDVHKGWQFTSSVTKPDVNKANFTKFILYNGSDSVTSTGLDNGSGNHLGLLIGLVILCVALGVAVMGGMLYYGFKKGLLRHVPSSYENFKNSKAEFDSKQDTVHI